MLGLMHGDVCSQRLPGCCVKTALACDYFCAQNDSKTYLKSLNNNNNNNNNQSFL